MRSSLRSISAALWSPVVVGIALVGCSDDDPQAAQIARGRELYGEMCALCHGADGEGYAADAANALANPHFLSVATDEFLASGIRRGRPGTPMSAWGESLGGPLTNDDVAALVALIRSWESAPRVDTSQVPVGEGQPIRGEAVFAVHCESCHGTDGLGGEFMSVANAEFLAAVDDGFLAHTIREGRPSTAMTAYEGTLTDQNVSDVIALLRSWQTPVDDTPCTLPTKNIADVIINPDGAPPMFGADRFVSVADVFTAYDGGARFRLLDARPPCDYVEQHITGAASVPFYAAEEYVSQLSPDDSIVAYCACPHAEASALADALGASGIADVKVLDEGFPGWLEAGHPVTGSE